MTFVRETCNKSPWGIHALTKVVSKYQIFVLCKDVTAIGKTGTELFTPQINIFTTFKSDAAQHILKKRPCESQ